MEQYTPLVTKIYRGHGFMTVSKYNNTGDTLYIADKESKVITAINTNDYSLLGTFEGHSGVIWNIDISEDDNILVSCSGDLTICFWKTSDGTLLHKTNEKCIPKYVTFQKKLQTNLFAILCESITKKTPTYLLIYDLNDIINNDYNYKYKLEWNIDTKINVLLWFSEDTLLLGCDNGTLILRNINDLTGQNDKQYKFHESSIKSIVWNKLKNCILTASLDTTAKIIDIVKWEVKSIFKSTVPINSACFNHNDRKVLIGGGIEAINVAKTSNNDLNLKIYRTSDQKLINHINSHFGPIRYIDKSPNTKNFVTASQDGTVKIYFINDENDKNNDIVESVNKNNISSKCKFGLYLNQSNNTLLTDETNKIENLSWKPTKVKEQEKKNNWIPGMPKPNIDNDSELFKINDMGIHNKINLFEKNMNEQNSTIRITNLPYDIQIKDLADMFDLYGRIEEKGGIKIKNYDDTTMAFIKYVYPESALKAIDKMNGTPYEHHIIGVELSKPK